MSVSLLNSLSSVAKVLVPYIIADSQDIKDIDRGEFLGDTFADHKELCKKTIQLENFRTTFEMNRKDKKGEEKSLFKRKAYITIPTHIKKSITWVFAEYVGELSRIFDKKDIEAVEAIKLSSVEEELIGHGGADTRRELERRLVLKRMKVMAKKSEELGAKMIPMLFDAFEKMTAPESRLDNCVLDAKLHYFNKKITDVLINYAPTSPFVCLAKELFDGFLKRLAKAISRHTWLSRTAINEKTFRSILEVAWATKWGYLFGLLLKSKASEIEVIIAKEKDNAKQIKILQKNAKSSVSKEKAEEAPLEEESDGKEEDDDEEEDAYVK